MINLLSKKPEEIERFRAAPWPFQRTFKTPLKGLNRFVAILLAPFFLEKGSLSSDEVVFEPENLFHLMTINSVQVENYWELNLTVEGQREIAVLLEAALGDWVDFVFVPTPELFAIYADHDEYVTFYAPNQPNLLSLVSDLERAGFEIVDYMRGASEGKWR